MIRMSLQETIEQAWNNRQLLSDAATVKVIEDVIEQVILALGNIAGTNY